MRDHIYHILSQTVLNQMKALHSACTNNFPGPSLLGLVLPEADVPEEDTFYAIYYIEETPVSFLSCFCADGDTAEISGFTDPAFRNRGLFSCLLKEAKEEAKHLFGDVVFTFQCLSDDPDTVSFCKSHGFVFSHAECMMEFRAENPSGEAFSISHKNIPDVRLLPSSVRNTLAKLHESSFDCLPVFSENYIDMVLSDNDTVSYLISADKTTVGLLHLTFSENIYLMGLGILPEYRRHGFAEAALRAALSLLPENSGLLLQVSTANTAAFSLYQKLGFCVSSRLDYYLSS